MAGFALRVEGVSKRYRIGTRVANDDSLRGAFLMAMTAPFRNLARLRRLSAFGADEESDVLWALRNVTFDVKEGEVLGIVGRNGAGKSTLLKILSRITPPTHGTVAVRGRVGSLLEVGTGFHAELTGRDNIYLSGAILGMSRAEIAGKFDEIVDFAGVERFIDTPVKRYSSGMYLRLAFAVAAHFQPEILIVDEVLAVGDAEFQRKCLGKMGEVGTDGRTVVFVSHNMNAIESLCDRAIFLQSGEVVADGPPHALINDYLRDTIVLDHERSWPDPESAPGNDRVRLHRAGVRPADGSAQDVITIESEILLEVEYWNLVPDARLSLVLEVRTLDGVTAFALCSDADPEWRGREFPVGLYRSVCRIPGGLLNDGAYRIRLAGVLEDSTEVVYSLEDLLVFSVRNVVEPGAGWHGQWAGVVRPRVEWRTDHVSQGSNPVRTPLIPEHYLR